jgi:arylsulfatase A-like enzyme
LKSNVLFVLTDDQRFDTIGALNNTVVKTPNMDRLVAMGTAFTHAHIPSGTSGAVCCPSRAMLHTGRSLFHLKGSGGQIPEEHTTMGEVFQGEGYDTFGTGKWHNGRPAFKRSFTDGEHIFFGGMHDHWNVPCYHFDPTGAYATQLPYCTDALHSNQVKYSGGDHIESGHHSSDILADATASWINEHSGDKPFLAYLSFLAPHDPRTMPEKFKTMYVPEDMELPPNFMGGHPFDNGALHLRDEELEAFPRSPDAIRTHIAEYYGMISHLDDCLGRVLSSLEDKGLLQDTLIVFTGDNGLALGQHGLMGKQNHYEHSIRVPLVIAGPGVQAGAITESPVYLFDILSTLCDHLGFKTPDSNDGLSFAHELKGERQPTRDKLFFAYEQYMRSVKKGSYKLTETCVDGKHNMTQLYDLKADPWELNNLATENQFQGLIKELRTDLFNLAKEWNDLESNWGKIFWECYKPNS